MNIHRSTHILVWLSLALALSQGTHGAALNTAFTYQGRLVSTNQAAPGSYDMRFRLYEVEVGGAPVVSDRFASNVVVGADGLFATMVDFGSVFQGTNYWLETAVATNRSTIFSLLAPRLPLTAMPYALYALKAGTATTASNVTGMIANSQLPSNVARLDANQTFAGQNSFSSNVGIGTTNPAANLHVLSRSTTVSNNTATFFNPLLGPYASHIHYGQSGDWYIRSACGCGNVVLQDNGGHVGIGTSLPATELEIYKPTPAGPTLRLTGPGGGGAQTRVDLATYNPGDNAPAARIEATDDGNWSAHVDILTKESGAAFNPLVSRLHVDANGKVGIGTTHPSQALHVLGDIKWGDSNAKLHTDQGGSIELGDSSSSNKVPYIDFHYGIGFDQDHNVRLINNASGWLALSGSLSVTGNFAAGLHAKANHAGTFVWADSNDYDFTSENNNGFAVRATGGVRFVSGLDGGGHPAAGVVLGPGGTGWDQLSDRNTKENFQPVDGLEILQRVATLPIQSWNMKTQSPEIRHIGPMAQDFAAAFSVGSDDRHINTVDADGVALAAIQGLHTLLEEKDKKLEAQAAELKDIKERLAALEKLANALARDSKD